MTSLARASLPLVLSLAFATPAAITRADPDARFATQDELHPGEPPHTEAPFPAKVRSLRILEETPVRSAPRRGAARLGRIAADTRVTWRRVLDADGACGRWIELEPRGFVCESEIAPSGLEPSDTHHPILRPGQIVPDRYDPAEFVADAIVKSSALVGLDGQRTCEAPHPAQPAGTRARGDVSDFAGLRLDCPGAPPLPFAWVQSRIDVKRPVAVYAQPRPDAITTETVLPRTLVSLADAEHQRGFYALAPDRWVRAIDLHVVRHAAAPDRLLPGEKWIDVDLDEQVLVAYEGDRAVYATLVATGTPTHPTPPSTYRIASKRAASTMAGSDYRASVPWTMFLDDLYALHSAYWHDRFGSRTSHGCINLPPLDARVLYHWSEPSVPPGWLSALGSVDAPGTLVRLRNRHRPNPPLEGYAKDVHRARARSVSGR